MGKTETRAQGYSAGLFVACLTKKEDLQRRRSTNLHLEILLTLWPNTKLPECQVQAREAGQKTTARELGGELLELAEDWETVKGANQLDWKNPANTTDIQNRPPKSPHFRSRAILALQ